MSGIGERKRNIRLDVIRAVAIVSVVWIHCQENGNFTLTAGGISVSAAAYLFGRMGVPLFFMLTGALLVPREIRPVGFWLTRALPLYLIAVFWNFVYAYGNLLFVQHAAPATVFTKAGVAAEILAALRLVPGEKHLWYLWFIVAVYVLMPLLALTKRLRTPVLFLLVCALAGFTGIRLAAGFSHRFADLAVYVMYVLAGYLLHDRLLAGGGDASPGCTPGRLGTPARTVLLSVLTLTAAVVYLFSYRSDSFQNAFVSRGLDIWWYYSPFLMLTAVCLFAAMLSAPARAGTAADPNSRSRADASEDRSPAARIAVFLSENSFGVYLVHIAVIHICFRAAFFTDTSQTSIVTVALAAIGTLAVSYAVSAVWGRIPYARALLFRRGPAPGCSVN